MSLLSILHSLWSPCCDASSSQHASTTSDSIGPAVNIDGTPMLDANMDIHGHPFGVTDVTPDLHSGQDTSWMDCSHDFGGSCEIDASQW